MSPKTKPARAQVNLREIFLGLQKQMLEELSTTRQVIKHPVSKGDAGELRWLKMLQEYLPERYCAERAFVLDCEGSLSQQIDLVIYDRQYSPFLFNQGGTKYVSAESVYAVFEVKPTLSLANLRYAAAKAASVRSLRRTSAPIPHAGGVFKPKKPPRIIAGLLTATQATSRPAILRELRQFTKDERLDLICALAQGSYDVSGIGKGMKIVPEEAGTALVSFFFSLLARLQAAGTAAAIEIDEYAKNL